MRPTEKIVVGDGRVTGRYDVSYRGYIEGFWIACYKYKVFAHVRAFYERIKYTLFPKKMYASKNKVIYRNVIVTTDGWVYCKQNGKDVALGDGGVDCRVYMK